MWQFLRTIVLIGALPAAGCSAAEVSVDEPSAMIRVDRSVAKRVVEQATLKTLHRDFAELQYLILKDDLDAFRAGFLLISKLASPPNCASADSATDQMLRQIAWALGWGEESFWKALRTLDSHDSQRVIRAYESCYRTEQPLDYQTDLKDFRSEQSEGNL